MTQAFMTIERAVAGSRRRACNASRGVRIAIGFGIVAAGYGAGRCRSVAWQRAWSDCVAASSATIVSPRDRLRPQPAWRVAPRF